MNFHPSISVNNHTYRGDYTDAIYLFKAICSTMLHRPDECRHLNYLASERIAATEGTKGWEAEDFLAHM